MPANGPYPGPCRVDYYTDIGDLVAIHTFTYRNNRRRSLEINLRGNRRPVVRYQFDEFEQIELIERDQDGDGIFEEQFERTNSYGQDGQLTGYSYEPSYTRLGQELKTFDVTYQNGGLTRRERGFSRRGVLVFESEIFLNPDHQIEQIRIDRSQDSSAPTDGQDDEIWTYSNFQNGRYRSVKRDTVSNGSTLRGTRIEEYTVDDAGNYLRAEITDYALTDSEQIAEYDYACWE